jgi:hypothetical protein
MRIFTRSGRTTQAAPLPPVAAVSSLVRSVTTPRSASPEPSDLERARAAAQILWNVQPTDRALHGWQGWDVPGDGRGSG